MLVQIEGSIFECLPEQEPGQPQLPCVLELWALRLWGCTGTAGSARDAA